LAQQIPDDGDGRLNSRIAPNRLPEDWPVYLGFLPSVVISVALAIVFGATTPCHERVSSHAANITSSPGDADDYVKGLAKRGITGIPGRELPPVRESRRGGPGPDDEITRSVVPPRSTGMRCDHARGVEFRTGRDGTGRGTSRQP